MAGAGLIPPLNVFPAAPTGPCARKAVSLPRKFPVLFRIHFQAARRRGVAGAGRPQA
jgi:hypothetical protein